MPLLLFASAAMLMLLRLTYRHAAAAVITDYRFI